jgi:acyl carrier protein
MPLSREAIREKLQEVVQRVFDNNTIALTDQTKAADIDGWDSLNQVRIILGCERAFGIRLKPREINALEDVGEMVDHIEHAINQQKQ